ncbi:MAG: copper amine oxidase N-terminal domain-containing protein, partial [Clostridia bacterium]|nr:copper amine oxidase N-terminal domain-containing protein [Clostridia bacterium]
GDTQTVTVTLNTRTVTMQIGSDTMYINGTPTVMNTAPEITNGRTFIPIRDIANALGIENIDWDESTQTVTLNR